MDVLQLDVSGRPQAWMTVKEAAILYACGHSPMVENGVSLGNKVDYLTFGGIYRGASIRAVPQTFIENVFAQPADVMDTKRRVLVRCFVGGSKSAGNLTLTAELRDGERVLNAVSACSVIVMGGSRYPGYQADFERTFRVLRSLPADIWFTSHAREWARYRKFVARDTAKSPTAPFIDPQGYRVYVDSGEARFRRGVVH